MNAYADSSFLASLYVEEVHSAEADRRMANGPSVWLTPLNHAELAHAFHFQVFRERISEERAREVWQQFDRDCQRGFWTFVHIPDEAWDTSIRVARRYVATLGIRTLDSLHVACALELQAEKFWTFDERQAKLAEAVGLDTTA